MNSPLRSLLFYLLRAPYRCLPLSNAARDRLRVWFLDRFPHIRPHRKSPRSVLASPRKAHYAGSRAIGFVDPSVPILPDPLPVKLVAFYLPQFHPIAENDAAWGQGYTEWTAVARANPQFLGHAQPRQPLLGEYDLRDINVMRSQAVLAKQYGLSAFCFYFYWFHGKTLLEQPLLQWLQATDIDFEFCLCWANESWSRAWDGRAGDLIVQQRHDVEDDLAFIAYIAPYLRDSRALRVNGQPVLLVYRPGLLPDAKATAARWRTWCRDNGIGEIHLAYVQSFERPLPADIGFDAAVEFPPNLCTPTDITTRQAFVHGSYAGNVLDWRDLPRHFLSKPAAAYPLYPAVNCGWDNEPRRPGRGRTLLHAAPRRYRDWLSATIRMRYAQSTQPCANRLVFINAWNEWGEGAVLEPDTSIGYAWLQAVADALRIGANDSTAQTPRRACVVIHAWYLDVFEELLLAVSCLAPSPRIVVTTTNDKAPQVRAIAQRLDSPVELHCYPNRGRDILPFLQIANHLLDQGESLLLKLHTKRSAHRDDGDAWRHELIDGLTALQNADDIQHMMRTHPNIGLLAPKAHLQPMTYYWGANQRNCEYLTQRLGIAAIQIKHSQFAAGSMFWCRLEALRPLLDAHLSEDEFEDESGQVDGTFAHAIERIIVPVVEAAGYQIQSWPPDAPLTTQRYRYAKRD